MHKDRSFSIAGTVILLALGQAHFAQADLPANLRSPVAAYAFYDLACQIRYTPGLGKAQADLAVGLLEAAIELDPDNMAYYGLAMELACRYGGRDYTRDVGRWLARYISPSAQFGQCRLAVDYALERLGTPKEKEQFIQALLESSAGRNAAVDSYLLTQYGLLVLERKNGPAARSLLTKAREIDPGNRLAFAKLVELAPESIEPADYLEHLRLVMQQRPMEMDVAMAFSQYAEQLELYELAASGYAYCAGLHAYLNKDKPLPPEIYLPWVLCLYQTDRAGDVVQIAQDLRAQGVVDLFLESVAAKAAAKAGRQDQASQLLADTEQMALHMVERAGQGALQVKIGPRHLAWFYSFVSPDKAKALDWANKAFAQEPNSVIAIALLAYALAVNGQFQYASGLADQAEGTQIGLLARALILLSGADKTKAAGVLRSAIAKDPGSLVADVARQYLSGLGLPYRPRVNAGAILERLSGRFGQTLMPRFVDPNQAIGLQVAVPSNVVRFGDLLVATVMISNQALEPIFIGDGWISGLVGVDVRVTGDLERDWPGMITTPAFSYTRLLPGRMVKSEVLLTTGPLEALLDASPQASVRLHFYVYLVGPDGKPDPAVPAVALTISRPAVELSAEILRNRHQRLGKAGLPEALATSKLFVGLLKEQYEALKGGARYRFRFSDWLPGMLKQALIQEPGLLTNPDPAWWELKTWTLANLYGLDLDIDLARAAGQCVTDQAWPVRVMAMCVLARQDGGFGPVLSWASKYDLHPLARRIAELLAGPVPAQGAGLPKKDL
ncbi:MAG: hypothetical protein QHH07_11285 [Sedimentisphaerales bacterium]|jgi:hypothetical protein|nr:hypothetical protein [Sedimentisphaerales bacterium]